MEGYRGRFRDLLLTSGLGTIKANASFLIEVSLIYNGMLISAVQRSDSVIHMGTFFFKILFHYGLLQDIEYRFVCCKVGPCWLSILYLIVSIC